MNRTLQILTNRHVWSILLLGFSSGLPYALLAVMLQAWFTTSGDSLIVIGTLSLVTIPYTWKFIWAPLMDRFTLSSPIKKVLGRRKSWLLVTQVGLLVLISSLVLFNPQFQPWIIFGIAWAIALFSASQDISINAYMVDIASEDERGMIAAVNVIGWRIGALLSGAIALIMAQHLGWTVTILMMSGCMLVGLLTTLLLCQEPNSDHHIPPQHSLYHDVLQPFAEFFVRKGLWIGIAILAVIILYKLGDAFALSLNSVFILRYLHFSLTDLGTIAKVGGLGISILGGFMGGLLMTRMRLLTALIVFGLLQAAANLTFMALAMAGHSMTWLIIATSTSYFTSALGTTAFVALIMALCNKQYSATQYALFSAIAFFGTTYLGPVAAEIVHHVGWVQFYWITFIISLPGVLLLIPLRTSLCEATKSNNL